MNRTKLSLCCCHFQEGRIRVQTVQCEGRPSFCRKDVACSTRGCFVQNDQVGGSRYVLSDMHYLRFIFWLFKQKAGDRVCQPSFLHSC